MGTKLSVELAKNVIHGLLANEEGVDDVLGHARVTRLTEGGQTPDLNTTSSDARVAISRIAPVQRTRLHGLHLAVLDKSIDSDTLDLRVLLIGNENSGNIDSKLGLLLGELRRQEQTKKVVSDEWAFGERGERRRTWMKRSVSNTT
jgi:hypothetical protein